jgi:hypothetical protein
VGLQSVDLQSMVLQCIRLGRVDLDIKYLLPSIHC